MSKFAYHLHLHIPRFGFKMFDFSLEIFGELVGMCQLGDGFISLCRDKFDPSYEGLNTSLVTQISDLLERLAVYLEEVDPLGICHLDSIKLLA